VSNGFQDKFEPYLVVQVSPQLPRYSEAFEDYGMNKITHTLEVSGSANSGTELARGRGCVCLMNA